MMLFYVWEHYCYGNIALAFPFTYICVLLHVLIRYYHNITSNTLTVLEAMATHGVSTLIYSSTCATYGEPEKMPITEGTPQVSVLKGLRMY